MGLLRKFLNASTLFSHKNFREAKFHKQGPKMLRFFINIALAFLLKVLAFTLSFFSDFTRFINAAFNLLKLTVASVTSTAASGKGMA
jgi:hypothetical protein